MKKALTTLLSLLLVLILTLSVGVAETVEPSGEGPASVSNMSIPYNIFGSGKPVLHPCGMDTHHQRRF